MANDPNSVNCHPFNCSGIKETFEGVVSEQNMILKSKLPLACLREISQKKLVEVSSIEVVCYYQAILLFPIMGL